MTFFFFFFHTAIYFFSRNYYSWMNDSGMLCVQGSQNSVVSASLGRKKSLAGRQAAGLGLVPTLPNTPCTHHLLPEGSSNSASTTAPTERDASLQTQVSTHQGGVPAPVSVDHDLRQPSSESGLSLESC